MKTSGGKWPAYNEGETCSDSGNVLWDPWLAKWHYDCLFSEHFNFHPSTTISLTFHIHLFIHPPRLFVWPQNDLTTRILTNQQFSENRVQQGLTTPPLVTTDSATTLPLYYRMIISQHVISKYTTHKITFQ
jgi:hypothetical protein